MSTVTIDTVSKEVRNKISKLGKDALLKKYVSGLFESHEEIVAARYFILKRGTSELEIAEADQMFYQEALAEPMYTEEEKAQMMSTGKHRSEMTEQEIEEAESRQAQIIADNKKKAADKKQADVTAKDSDNSEKQSKAKSTKSKATTTTDSTTEQSQKEQETPSIKLTAHEFKLFELFKVLIGDDITLTNKGASQEALAEQMELNSLREFKGILSSLRKKDVVAYLDDQDVMLTQLSVDMLTGKMDYREKDKNERNFFKNERLTQTIDGKSVDKSSYVRSLLRKNKHTTYGELKEALEKAGYPKLYHSELQRCRMQLGIEIKKED